MVGVRTGWSVGTRPVRGADRVHQVIHTFVVRLRDTDDEPASIAGEVEDVATGRITRVTGGEHLLAVLSGRPGGDGSGHRQGARPLA